MAEDSSAIVGTLQRTRDGTAVPVSPPAWNPTGGDATLYAYISAHNSYVAAMAASRKTSFSESPVDEEGLTLDALPPSKRPRQEACDVDEEEGTVGGSVGFGGPAVIGVDSSVGRDASPRASSKTALGVTRTAAPRLVRRSTLERVPLVPPRRLAGTATAPA